MPSPSKVYREKGNDSDDDDLDDLDGELAAAARPSSLLPDVLASFNAPSPAKPPASQPVAGPSKPRQSTTSPTVEDADDEFDESLARGMESLLLQLAGTNPPGPMPDTKPKAKTAGLNAKTNDKLMGIPEGEKSGQMSAEEEEKAWQKAIEMMLSGEGLEALGLDKEGNAQAGPSRPPPTLPNAPRGDFDETIRQTMEQLKSAGTAGKSPTDDASLAALLAQLGSDPSALDGLGDGDDELGGLLDGMMAQLMTREVLEEPMAELASKVRMPLLVGVLAIFC